MNPTVARRTVLAAGVAGAGAVALAACSSKKSGSGSATGQAAGQTSGQTVAKLADITVGRCVSAKLADGSPAIVARPSDSTAACFSAICTHMGCTVNPAGAELHCPCHGSIYDALTGAVKQGPAPKPLPKIAVHVANGDVVTT
ncbi:MAG: ferredoxin [Pseudonocardiales bacterium]|nr:ferredoxin [Pseudonocardiales bacterium]